MLRCRTHIIFWVFLIFRIWKRIFVFCYFWLDFSFFRWKFLLFWVWGLVFIKICVFKRRISHFLLNFRQSLKPSNHLLKRDPLFLTYIRFIKLQNKSFKWSITWSQSLRKLKKTSYFPTPAESLDKLLLGDFFVGVLINFIENLPALFQIKLFRRNFNLILGIFNLRNFSQYFFNRNWGFFWLLRSLFFYF